MAPRPSTDQISAKSRVNPALNADLDPTGRPFGFPETPGGHGFKLRCNSIVSHCLLELRPVKGWSTPRQVKLADLQEVGAPERVALEEPLVVDHPPDTSPSAPSVAQAADTSSATPMAAEGTHVMQPPSTAKDGAAAGRADAAAPVQSPATEREANALSGSAPLPRLVRPPRPRPHEAGTVRAADPKLSLFPSVNSGSSGARPLEGYLYEGKKGDQPCSEHGTAAASVDRGDGVDVKEQNH
jgi:hypothetical protein